MYYYVYTDAVKSYHTRASDMYLPIEDHLNMPIKAIPLCITVSKNAFIHKVIIDDALTCGTTSYISPFEFKH